MHRGVLASLAHAPMAHQPTQPHVLSFSTITRERHHPAPPPTGRCSLFPLGPMCCLTCRAAGSSKAGAQPGEKEEDRHEEGAGHRHDGVSPGARVSSCCAQPTAQGCRLPHPRRFLPHGTACHRGAHPMWHHAGHSSGAMAHHTGAPWLIPPEPCHPSCPSPTVHPSDTHCPSGPPVSPAMFPCSPCHVAGVTSTGLPPRSWTGGGMPTHSPTTVVLGCVPENWGKLGITGAVLGDSYGETITKRSWGQL